MTVYLLHFHPPYKHARHYMGFVNGGEKELAARLDTHRKGRGARLVAVIVAAGHDFELARIWPDADRKMERRLKRQRMAPRLCPICQRQEAGDNGTRQGEVEGGRSCHVQRAPRDSPQGHGAEGRDQERLRVRGSREQVRLPTVHGMTEIPPNFTRNAVSGLSFELALDSGGTMGYGMASCISA